MRSYFKPSGVIVSIFEVCIVEKTIVPLHRCHWESSRSLWNNKCVCRFVLQALKLGEVVSVVREKRGN